MNKPAVIVTTATALMLVACSAAPAVPVSSGAPTATAATTATGNPTPATATAATATPATPADASPPPSPAPSSAVPTASPGAVPSDAVPTSGATAATSDRCMQRTPWGYSEFFRVDVVQAAGCVRISSSTWVELDVSSLGRGAMEFAFLANSTTGSPILRPLTQVQMAIVGGSDVRSCEAAVGYGISRWDPAFVLHIEPVSLDDLAGRRICVSTTDGALVELRPDSWHPAVGKLVIRYRTLEGGK